MAIRDNIRVLYQDGLILGADELGDDQEYFRAALERRSLSRDMFGIAWGLELTRSGNAVRVSPGVAYGGDGKVIVVRESEDLSSDLASKPVNTQWAVYIRFTEAEDAGAQQFKYCGTTLDPRIAEGYRFVYEDVTGQGLANSRREGPRLEPQAELAGKVDEHANRVLLGIAVVNAGGTFDVQGAGLPFDKSLRTAAAATPDPGPAAAQYIGVTAEGIVHPHRWSKLAGGFVLPAVQLDPDLGIHLREPTLAHEDVFLSRDGSPSFRLNNDGTLLTLSHVAGPTDTKILTVAGPVLGPPAVQPQMVVKADLVADKTLSVTGTSTFSGLPTMNGGLTVASGKTELQGLQVDLDAELKSALVVDAGLTAKGGLTVGDPSTTTGASASFLGDVDIKKTLSVGDLATLTALKVTGQSTLGAVSVTSLSSPGVALSASSLTVSQLTVNGISTLNGNAGVQGSLGVTADGTFGGNVVTASGGICIKMTNTLPNGSVAAVDSGGAVTTPTAPNASNIIGVVVAPGVVAVAGVAEARVSGPVTPGDLLVGDGSGGLRKGPAILAVGTLVAKALSTQFAAGPDFHAKVLLTLG